MRGGTVGLLAVLLVSSLAPAIASSAEGVGPGDAALGLSSSEDDPDLRSGPPVSPMAAPVASATADPYTAPIGQSILFSGAGSYDADGTIVSYNWTFGDGYAGTGVSAWHSYGIPGNYTVDLTVLDNASETDAAFVVVNITGRLPSAQFYVFPAPPFHAGDPLEFDGYASFSPDGTIVAFDWDFGDGDVASGGRVTHAFSSAGTYTVRLTVTDNYGSTASATNPVLIESNDIPLRPYEHRAGFRVPIPATWSLTEDEVFEDLTIETELFGPEHDGFTTNILIETDRDSTVREDNGYLAELVQDVLDGVRQDVASSYLSEGPAYRQIAGHAGVVFAITEPDISGALVQKFAVLVSQPHGRYWFLLLSVDADYLQRYDGTFEAMVDGFEITIQPGSLTTAVVGFLAAILGVVAVILIVYAVRRKRRAPAPAYSTTPPPYVPASAPAASAVTCTACGTPAPRDYRFCVKCGAALPAEPSPAPAPAPPTPPDSGAPPAPPPPP